MRFEKLSENKIRIILDHEDLIEEKIDFHSFMASPIESQSLFFEMLNKAEKEIGFVTENYNIKIEAIQLSSGDFVITITRSQPEEIIDNKNSNIQKKKIHVRRKKPELSSTNTIYCFHSFDDFCSFSNLLNAKNISIKTIAKNISLYEYKKQYYLVFSNINTNNNCLKNVFFTITEFATYINNADLFKRNLLENGKIIMKNNAIQTAISYFA